MESGRSERGANAQCLDAWRFMPCLNLARLRARQLFNCTVPVSTAQQWLCQHGRSRRFGVRLRRVQPPAGTSSASTPGPSMYNALASKLAKKQVQYDIDQSLESMIRKRVTDPDTTTLLSWLKAISIGGLASCEKQKMQRACLGPSLA